MVDRARDPAFDARSILTRAPADTMHDLNRRKLIRAAMVAPGSEASLARRTHLSQAAVSTAVHELLQEGVLVADSSNGGRLRLGPIHGVAVGVEVNHSDLLVAARPVASPKIEYADIDFSADQPGTLWIRHAVRLIEEAVTKTGLSKDHIVSIGVGIPASVDPRTSRITQPSSSLGWELTGDPREEFQTHFPTAPVIVDNEANFAAFGEYTHGTGQNGHETMLFVKASTGIGAGLVVGGLIYRGRHGVAGEIGHLAMNPLGPVCRCGNRGCLETLIGSVRLLDQVRQAYAGYRLDFPTTIESMIERANSGDPVCRRVLLDAARVLGLTLATVCNVVNPEIVVLGGELGLATDLLVTTIYDSMHRHALRGMFIPDFAPVQVVGSTLGRQAGARGALSFALSVDQTGPSPPVNSAVEPKNTEVDSSGDRVDSSSNRQTLEHLPLHWSILAFDVEEFSDTYRDDPARLAVRTSLHDVLHESFRAAGLPWSADKYESRGDGAIVLVSPLVPKVLLIDPLFGCLRAALADHNRNARLAERFRLRCAVHAGEVSSDAYGMSGIDLILACRMLDSMELRASLLHSATPMATIVSDSIYQAVVRHGYREIDPATYHPVSVRVKKNRINAWLHLPGAVTPPVVTA